MSLPSLISLVRLQQPDEVLVWARKLVDDLDLRLGQVNKAVNAIPPPMVGSITVRKNSGVNIGTEPRLNFIEGTNITLGIVDVPGNEVAITINSSGGGSVTGAANVNIGGVGVFDALVGTTLDFRGVDAGSSKVTSTLDAGNKKINIDVVEANLTLNNIGGILGVSKGGSGANLSGTGGANQFVKQSTLGGAFSVGTITDADVPDTITLSNITQITTRLHSSLQSLGSDDHVQYALLAGRAGGQQLNGGTAASENLTLDSTAHATKGSVIVGTVGNPATLQVGNSAGNTVVDIRSNTQTTLVYRQYTNTISGPTMIFEKSRGTQTSPAQTLANDILGTVRWIGMQDTLSFNINESATIFGRADENNTATALGGHLEFWTANLGAAGIVERVRILGTGETTIFTGPTRQLTLGSAGGGRSSFVDSSHAANIDYTLPSAHVTNGFLRNNGTGTLSWATLVAGDIPSSTTIAGDVTGTLGATTVVKINGIAYNADPLAQYLKLTGRTGITNFPVINSDVNASGTQTFGNIYGGANNPSQLQLYASSNLAGVPKYHATSSTHALYDNYVTLPFGALQIYDQTPLNLYGMQPACVVGGNGQILNLYKDRPGYGFSGPTGSYDDPEILGFTTDDNQQVIFWDDSRSGEAVTWSGFAWIIKNNLNSTRKISTQVASFNTGVIAVDGGTLTLTGAGSLGLLYSPTFKQFNNAGTGTLAAGAIAAAVKMSPIVSAGWTVPGMYGVYVAKPVNSVFGGNIGGTITELAGIKIEDLKGSDTGITNAYSLYSLGPAVSMIHNGPIIVGDPGALTTAYTAITLYPNASSGGGGNVSAGVKWSSTFTWTSDQTAVAGPFFAYGPTIANSGSRTLVTHLGFGSTASFNAANGTVMTINDVGIFAFNAYIGFSSDPSFSVTGTGTGTIQTISHFRIGPGGSGGLATGWAATTEIGLDIYKKNGAGTLGTFIGVNIQDWGTRATTMISLKSATTTMSMNHAGPARFGSVNAPTNPTKTAMHVDGGLIARRTTFSNAAYTIDNAAGFGDFYLAQTGTMSAARTVTLPAAATVGGGRIIIVADESNTVTGTNKITVSRAGADTFFDGATTKDITTAGGVLRIVSDGTSKWMVI